MKILAIDVGAGTQDILLFDSRENIENCVSLVLPTPSKILAERLKAIERDVYIHGDTIGGGALARVISRHIKKGRRVVMDEPSAYSIRNDLDEVRSMGIEVGERPRGGDFEDFKITEIEIPLIQRFLSQFGEDLQVDAVAVAVQDHGVSPKGVSDRAFRFENMESMLRRDNRPESFHFPGDSVPLHYLRMRSAVTAVRRSSSAPVLIMDTSIAAVLGCADETKGSSLIVNVGNGHTIAALLVEKRIDGLYEHHTHELNGAKLEDHLRRFAKGQLTKQEVFDDNGHGVVTLTACPGDLPVIVTGPNRDLFNGTSLPYRYAAPGGSTMMAGPMGLVRATEHVLEDVN
jgi:uncharacterized protein (DUF1786 family)